MPNNLEQRDEVLKGKEIAIGAALVVMQKFANMQLSYCGNKDVAQNDNTPCRGCPALGEYGGEYQDCAFLAFLDVARMR